jgi:short-subunit dehydrogenase
MPGSYQAIYNATKAFINSFSFALREELKESGVTVSCLMPGATETEFFKRADLMGTAIGQAKKDDAGDDARMPTSRGKHSVPSAFGSGTK